MGHRQGTLVRVAGLGEGGKKKLGQTSVVFPCPSHKIPRGLSILAQLEGSKSPLTPMVNSHDSIMVLIKSDQVHKLIP